MRISYGLAIFAALAGCASNPPPKPASSVTQPPATVQPAPAASSPAVIPPSPGDDSPVLVTVNGMPLTEGMLNALVLQENNGKAQELTPAQRKSVIDTLVKMELLAQD